MRIEEMTAVELGSAIKEGKLTAVEAVEAVFEKIEQTDQNVNAYITLDREDAITAAKKVQAEIEAGKLTSPLAGVPIAIKDNICTHGLKTSCASKILGEFTPVYNATVIEKLKDAGAIIIGKTNMDEFAMGSTTETSFYGPTKNPWDLNKVPGGSSGGSAAAVASGQAVCALGSDTGGSIRQPASYCGVTGFKPTYGAVSRFGLIAYASSLDQIGPIAKDVRDCAAIMDVIAGTDKMDGTTLAMEHPSYLDSLNGDVKGMKIALLSGRHMAGLDADVAQCIQSFAKTLEDAGAVIEEVDLPLIDFVIPAYYIIAAAEASSNLARFDGVKYGFRSGDYEGITDLYNATRSEGFGDETKKRILLGSFVLSSGYYDAYYQKALKVKNLIKNSFDEIYAKFDLIVCPVAPTTAPKLGESLSDPLQMYLSDVFTVSANLAGLPALSVPCGFDKSGMPVGAQIIGQRLDETKVLNAGHAYQLVTDHHKKMAEVN